MNTSDISKEYEQLLRKRNVNFVDYGHKVTGGKKTNTPCLTVGVRRKVNLEDLPAADRVPPKVGGIVTDVIEIGDVRLVSSQEVKGGHPIRSHIGTGTVGFVFTDNEKSLAVTNRHVVDDISTVKIQRYVRVRDGLNRDMGVVSFATPIYFDETPHSSSGMGIWGRVLGFFKRLEVFLVKFIVNFVNFFLRLFGKQWNPLNGKERKNNYVDGALCILNSDVPVHNGIKLIGHIKGTRKPSINDSVRKYGHTSKLTKGTVVTAGSGFAYLAFSGGNALFRDQVLIEGLETSFARAGDSGSLVVDSENRAVGLLFAVTSKGYGIANRIDHVTRELGVEI